MDMFDASEVGGSTAGGPRSITSAKAAIVHDWFPSIAGGERVVREMVQTAPNSSLYSVFDFLSDDDREHITGGKDIAVSKLNNLPYVEKYYRSLLLLSMRATEAFDMSGHDMVLSSSVAVAKGVLTKPGQLHMAYIHTPARYAWDLTHEYIRTLNGPLGLMKRVIAREVMHRYRIWDMRTPQSVDVMIANSKFVRDRIRKVYGRDAEVIYPPVDVERFQPGKTQRDNFYLIASRLVPYKRIDVLVEAFKALPDKQLVVIGDGPDRRRLQALSGSNVSFLGYQPHGVLLDYMQRARAFLFAAHEDFGIAPVEAQACGTPVIALRHGGTAETIVGLDQPNPTGIHFEKPDVRSVVDAIELFERQGQRIEAEACRRNALRFGAERFRQELHALINRHWRAGSDFGLHS